MESNGPPTETGIFHDEDGLGVECINIVTNKVRIRNLPPKCKQMLKRRLYILFIGLFLVCALPLTAQLSLGGAPLSISQPELFPLDGVPIHTLTPPNVAVLLEEDADRDRNGYNLRDAIAIPVNKGFSHGAWMSLSDGSRLWRMMLKAEGALSMEVNFSELFIPIGARLFLFNPEGSHIIGSYSDINNKSDGRISVDMVIDEDLILEYYEPSNVIGQGVLNIQDVAYRYRDVMGLLQNSEGNGSDACQVDVGCSEGDAWQDQVNSVVRVRTRINGQFFWCSGTVMNNTALDCKPYLLTSLHCALDNSTLSTESDFSFYRFYFKYQRPSCGAGGASQSYSISGCIRRADSNDNGGENGSDYLLVEMTSEIPEAYEPYYAGWDANPIPPAGGGVGIHHPAADVKKISTYSDNLLNASWGTFNTHWLVRWEETDNGHGVTEGGSSGSALFDVNGRVVGTLTGGSSFCDEVQEGGQNQPDFYGKMSYHWSQNPNPPSERLREWLDPIDSGVMTFDGSSNPCGLTGLKDIAELREVNIWPNPSDGTFWIEVDTQHEIEEIQVIDYQGRIIYLDQSSGFQQDSPYRIDIHGHSFGIYLLNVIYSDGLKSTSRLQFSY